MMTEIAQSVVITGLRMNGSERFIGKARYGAAGDGDGVPAGSSIGLGGAHALGLTLSPSFNPSWPAVTTFSPAFNPSLTTVSSERRWPIFTSRMVTVLPAFTTKIYGPCWPTDTHWDGITI